MLVAPNRVRAMLARWIIVEGAHAVARHAGRKQCPQRSIGLTGRVIGSCKDVCHGAKNRCKLRAEFGTLRPRRTSAPTLYCTGVQEHSRLSPLKDFHPAVGSWFRRAFTAPTDPQNRAWPEIRAGRNVLIAAPTGSGKTLAAFLAAIDALVRQGLSGGLPDETQVVYVSPLKALSNDIHRNLELPLAGIREELKALGLPEIEIRAQVRTGDTPQSERAAMRKRPPHILVTTPESLYLLLTSDAGRGMLATARSVIVDEIHAVAPNKRGAHLALSLERLDSLAARPLVRIGLSATQKPIEEVGKYLVGAPGDCAIVDHGYTRQRDIA